MPTPAGGEIILTEGNASTYTVEPTASIEASSSDVIVVEPVVTPAPAGTAVPVEPTAEAVQGNAAPATPAAVEPQAAGDTQIETPAGEGKSILNK